MNKEDRSQISKEFDRLLPVIESVLDQGIKFIPIPVIVNDRVESIALIINDNGIIKVDTYHLKDK